MNDEERAVARKRFSKELQRQRELLGLNRKELAEKIGVSGSMYTPYERSEKTPGLEVLAAMDEFGLDVLSLLCAYRGDRND